MHLALVENRRNRQRIKSLSLAENVIIINQIKRASSRRRRDVKRSRGGGNHRVLFATGGKSIMLLLVAPMGGSVRA